MNCYDSEQGYNYRNSVKEKYDNMKNKCTDKNCDGYEYYASGQRVKCNCQKKEIVDV